MTHVIFNPRTFASNLPHNLEYFFIGRYAGMLGYFFPGFFAMLALLAAPRRRPRLAMAGARVGAGAGAHLRHRDAVHVERRRRRQPLLLQRLRRDAVPAAADRVDRRWRSLPWAVGGLFVAPMVLNPFVASFTPERERQGRTAADAAGRTDAAERSAGVHRRRNARPRVVRRSRRRGIPGSWSRSSMTTPTAGKRTRASGRAAIRAPSSSSRPTSRFARRRSPSPPGPCRLDVTIRLGGRSARRARRAGEHAADRDLHARRGCIYEKEVAGRPPLERLASRRRGGFTPIFFDRNVTDARYLGVRDQTDARSAAAVTQSRRRHLEPADGRGRPHGDRARADAGAPRRRARGAASSSRRERLRPPGVRVPARPG